MSNHIFIFTVYKCWMQNAVVFAKHYQHFLSPMHAYDVVSTTTKKKQKLSSSQLCFFFVCNYIDRTWKSSLWVRRGLLVEIYVVVRHAQKCEARQILDLVSNSLCLILFSWLSFSCEPQSFCEHEPAERQFQFSRCRVTSKGTPS